MGINVMLAAANSDQLKEAMGRAAENSIVAFATLDDDVLTRMMNKTAQQEIPVYFYESG
ncbi:MAG: hypothetical protein K9L17_09230 [Clostridiales bacterium]|nr:hypothetical protein [Clostridiales bacterium]MCF8022860.1 hypothetical protein [Clostridiales bacterium]